MWVTFVGYDTVYPSNVLWERTSSLFRVDVLNVLESSAVTFGEAVHVLARDLWIIRLHLVFQTSSAVRWRARTMWCPSSATQTRASQCTLPVTDGQSTRASSVHSLREFQKRVSTTFTPDIGNIRCDFPALVFVKYDCGFIFVLVFYIIVGRWLSQCGIDRQRFNYVKNVKFKWPYFKICKRSY
jgi:hypothetical protein